MIIVKEKKSSLKEKAICSWYDVKQEINSGQYRSILLFMKHPRGKALLTLPMSIKVKDLGLTSIALSNGGSRFPVIVSIDGNFVKEMFESKYKGIPIFTFNMKDGWIYEIQLHKTHIA